MIPASDIRFLANLTHQLSSTAHKRRVYCAGKRRSAVAIILHFSDVTVQQTLKDAVKHCRQKHKILTAANLMSTLARTDESSFLSTEREKEELELPLCSKLSVLFIKSKNVALHQWSGAFTFPGGARDCECDANDYIGCCRNVQESLSIPLRTSPDFVLLGQLHDVPLHSRSTQRDWRLLPQYGRDVQQSERHLQVSRWTLVQSRFVFLHLSDLTPLLHVDREVVEGAKWVSLNRFDVHYARRSNVVYSLSNFLNIKHNTYHREADDFNAYLANSLAPIKMAFPSVLLEFDLKIKEDTNYNSYAHHHNSRNSQQFDRIHVEECESKQQKYQEEEEEEEEESENAKLSNKWQIWGHTLRTIHEIMLIGDYHNCYCNKNSISNNYNKSRNKVYGHTFSVHSPSMNELSSDWPLFYIVNNNWLQLFCVNPFHGYYEWCYLTYEVRYMTMRTWRKYITQNVRKIYNKYNCITYHKSKQDESAHYLPDSWQYRCHVIPPHANPILLAIPGRVNVWHLLWFCIDIALFCTLLYSLTCIIYSFATLLRMSVGLEPELVAKHENNIREYFNSRLSDSIIRHNVKSAVSADDTQSKERFTNTMNDNNDNKTESESVTIPLFEDIVAKESLSL